MKLPEMQTKGASSSIADGLISYDVVITKITDASNYLDKYDSSKNWDLRLDVEYYRKDDTTKTTKKCCMFGQFKGQWDKIAKRRVNKQAEWDFSKRNAVLFFLSNILGRDADAIDNYWHIIPNAIAKINESAKFVKYYTGVDEAGQHQFENYNFFKENVPTEDIVKSFESDKENRMLGRKWVSYDNAKPTNSMYSNDEKDTKVDNPEDDLCF